MASWTGAGEQTDRPAIQTDSVRFCRSPARPDRRAFPRKRPRSSTASWPRVRRRSRVSRAENARLESVSSERWTHSPTAAAQGGAPRRTSSAHRATHPASSSGSTALFARPGRSQAGSFNRLGRDVRSTVGRRPASRCPWQSWPAVGRAGTTPTHARCQLPVVPCGNARTAFPDPDGVPDRDDEVARRGGRDRQGHPADPGDHRVGAGRIVRWGRGRPGRFRPPRVDGRRSGPRPVPRGSGHPARSAPPAGWAWPVRCRRVCRTGPVVGPARCGSARGRSARPGGRVIPDPPARAGTGRPASGLESLRPSGLVPVRIVRPTLPPPIRPTPSP